MQKEVLEYLKTQTVGVLALEMLDGSPHAATLHFAHVEDPFIFYFETNPEYRKAEPLLKSGKVRASLVIGTRDDEKVTLQMDGEASLIREAVSKAKFEEVYFAKFPGKLEKYKSDKLIAFSFTPTWWRFTDWRPSGGKLILSSY